MIGPDDPTEAQVLRSAALTDELRAWMRTRRTDNDMVVAGALAYELAALIARNAGTEANALDLITVWADVMRDQIRALGVETEHP